MTQRAFLYAYSALLFAVSSTIILRTGSFLPLTSDKINIEMARPDQKDGQVQEKIHLRFVLADDAVKMLKTDRRLPAAVTVTAESNTNSIVVAGSAHDVARVREIVSKADVPVRSLIVRMRLVRVSFDASGARKEETVQSPTISAADGVKANIAVTGGETDMRIDVLPRFKPRNAVDLAVTVTVGSLAGSRRGTIPLDKTMMFTGIVEKWDQPGKEGKATADIATGKMPHSAKNFVGYFLEVTASEQKDRPTTP